MKKIKVLVVLLILSMFFISDDVFAAKLNKNIKSIKKYDQTNIYSYCINGTESECTNIGLSSNVQLSKGDIINYEVYNGQYYNFNVVSVDKDDWKIDMVMTLKDMMLFNKTGTGNLLASSPYTKDWNVNNMVIFKYVQDNASLQFNQTNSSSSGSSRFLYPNEFDSEHDAMFKSIEYPYWVEAFSSSTPSRFYYGSGFVREDNMDVTAYAHYIRPVININLYEKTTSDIIDDKNDNSEDDIKKNEVDKIPDEVYDQDNNKISESDIVIKDNGQVVTKDGKPVYDKDGNLVYVKNGQQVKAPYTMKTAFIGYLVGSIVLILGVMIIIQSVRKNKEEFY